MNSDPENDQTLKIVSETKNQGVGNKRRGNMTMDLAIAGAIAISVVLWILSGVAQYKHRDTAVIWTIYFAIVLTILVFFLTWQKREWESGSGAAAQTWHPTPHDHIKWTDYAEDYFYGVIWRWEYRPQMGNKEPRNITAWCPECNRLMESLPGIAIAPDGGHTSIFVCCNHPLRQYFINAGRGVDHYEGIRALIREKLKTGRWKKVVQRQVDVRSGRI